MTDTFYRATQALKKLPKLYQGTANRAAPTKLTDAHIAEIKNLYQDGKNKAEIARYMGIADSTVYNAVRRLERSGAL